MVETLSSASLRIGPDRLMRSDEWMDGFISFLERASQQRHLVLFFVFTIHRSSVRIVEDVTAQSHDTVSLVALCVNGGQTAVPA